MFLAATALGDLDNSTWMSDKHYLSAASKFPYLRGEKAPWAPSSVWLEGIAEVARRLTGARAGPGQGQSSPEAMDIYTTERTDIFEFTDPM